MLLLAAVLCCHNRAGSCVLWRQPTLEWGWEQSNFQFCYQPPKHALGAGRNVEERARQQASSCSVLLDQQCCVSCRTVREIRRDMHKQREWRNELEKMKIGNIVGCLNVESKTLRNSLVPITTRTLDQVNPRVLLDTPQRHDSACLTIHGLRLTSA